MKRTAEIAKSMKTAFTAHATLPTLVPGGLVFGKRKAGTAKPYAQLHVSLAETGWETGLEYVQRYDVEILVWATELVATAGAIQAALDTLLGMTHKLENLTSPALTLQCVLDPAGVVEDPERAVGDITLIAAAKWQITIQDRRI